MQSGWYTDRPLVRVGAQLVCRKEAAEISADSSVTREKEGGLPPLQCLIHDASSVHTKKQVFLLLSYDINVVEKECHTRFDSRSHKSIFDTTKATSNSEGVHRIRSFAWAAI
jgi:hypothetical protein